MNLNLKQLRLDFKKNRLESKTLAIRLRALIELVKRRSNIATSYSELDYFFVAEKFDCSIRTLQRWKAEYAIKGCEGLRSKKRGNNPKIIIKGWTAAKITEYRALYNWGAETIQAHLALDHGIVLSEYKINTYLIENNLIKRIKKKKLKNKHTSIVFVETPGAHTQTDVKHLPRILGNNRKTYVYNFVDHASRWEYKESFESYTAANTKTFFEHVIKAAPFKILCSQTDNGVEFTSKFISHSDNPSKNCYEIFLADQNIKHRLIPPGEKELNGLVERSHRADDEEFYHRVRPDDLKEFNKILKEHSKWRNEVRRKKPLVWRTTFDWLCDYSLRYPEEIKFAG